MRRAAVWVWLGLLVPALGACSGSTAKLSPQLEQRFASEGIVRRAADIDFRYSHALGTTRSGWEEWPASIVITQQTVYIHDQDQVRLEITPRSTGQYRVRREGGRVSVRTGTGASVRSWAFHPPDNPEQWVIDLRAVIAGTAGAKRRGR